MSYIATITSKKQFTIPSKAFKKAGFKIGERVIVSEENGTLKITPAVRLVEELSGSIKVPKHMQGNIDEAIKKAKEEYFKKRFK